MTGTTGTMDIAARDRGRLDAGMTAPPIPNLADLRLRIDTPTEDGLLRLAARHTRGRWVVAADCGSWRGLGLGTDLRLAADSALALYASGIALGRWRGDAS